MTNAAVATKKPRVTSLIILTLICGIVAFILARAFVPDLSFYPSLGVAVPFESAVYAYGSLITIVLSLIGIVLIARYMRLGLILAAIVSTLVLLAYVRGALTEGLNVIGLFIILIGAAGLGYSLWFLLREPNKSFFH